MTRTTAEILGGMDRGIDNYQKGNDIVAAECGVAADGRIDSRREHEYKRRLAEVRRRYEKDENALVMEFNRHRDSLHESVSMQEPRRRLAEDWPLYMPTRLAFGRLQIRYANLNADLPQEIVFPLSKALCVPQEYQTQIIPFLVRMLYALPIGKFQFHASDGFGYGDALGCFDKLLGCEAVFPDKRVFCTEKEVKDFLEEMTAKLANMRQNLFPLHKCRTWSEYNHKMCLAEQPKKILPYQVLLFFGLPQACSSESLEKILHLAGQGAAFGLGVIFSYEANAMVRRHFSDGNAQEQLLNDRSVELVNRLVQNSIPLQDIWKSALPQMKHLSVTAAGPVTLSLQKMELLLQDYGQFLHEQQKSIVEIDELVGGTALFDRSAGQGLSLPLGTKVSNGEVIEMPLGNQPVHALVCGATGSGKSNLLHVLIIGACWHYAPQELRLYLMDFKDGVEFAKYAEPNLPHASLIAKKADSAYGLSVLKHLINEYHRRNELFQKQGVADYTAFRKKCPHELLPRLLLIVDEFQGIFEGQTDKVKQDLDSLAKKGRSTGIHMVFATQTLRGLDTGHLEAQFGARLALKCDADDSKRVLDMSNDAAASLTVPYAILNTQSGMIQGNEKFAVPMADDDFIREIVQKIQERCAGAPWATKVFDGKNLPSLPAMEAFACAHGVCLKLGQELDYDEKPFILPLCPKNGENLLCVGRYESCFYAVLYTALTAADINEVIYVGERKLNVPAPKPMTCYKSLKDMAEHLKQLKESGHKLGPGQFLLLEKCDMSREFPGSYGSLGQDANILLEYWRIFNNEGSFMAAFYDSYAEVKGSKLPLDNFSYQTGYGLGPSDVNKLTGIVMGGAATAEHSLHACLSYQGELQWFQPFELLSAAGEGRV